MISLLACKSRAVNPNPDPHPCLRDPDPHQRDNPDPDPHQVTSQNVWHMSLFILSLNLEARIRIRFKVKGRIRIHINVMRIRNTLKVRYGSGGQKSKFETLLDSVLSSYSYPRLVRTPADLEDESLNFKPEMTHQIYGDNENIFGYKGLQVQI